MNNLGQIHEQLQDEWSRLQNQWQNTASQWNDISRQRFEREFMNGYEEVIYTTMKQMDNLTQVLAQISKQIP